MVVDVVETGIVGDESCRGFRVFVAVGMVFGLFASLDFMDGGADEGEDDGHCLLSVCFERGV